jgi:hypothetical protein
MKRNQILSFVFFFLSTVAHSEDLVVSENFFVFGVSNLDQSKAAIEIIGKIPDFRDCRDTVSTKSDYKLVSVDKSGKKLDEKSIGLLKIDNAGRFSSADVSEKPLKSWYIFCSHFKDNQHRYKLRLYKGLKLLDEKPWPKL